MKHYGSNDIEIISPRRSAPTIPAVPTSSTLAPSLSSARSYDQNPGGIIAGGPKRWLAESQRRTLDSFTHREVAERKLIEADTARRKSLVDNYRARQELAEVPQLLATESTLRAMRRSEEIRDLPTRSTLPIGSVRMRWLAPSWRRIPPGSP